MIADLHSRQLSPARWGHKAARLAQSAQSGIAVPTGICLDRAQMTAPTHHQEAVLHQWLTARRPTKVIVRSSSTGEDTEHTAAAGRLLTLRDTSPTASSVRDAVQAVHQSLVDAGQGGSAIVQQQLPAELMGVTFTRPDGTFLTEGHTTPAAVTDGHPPAFRLDCNATTYTLTGHLDVVPPTRLAQDLRRLTHHLGELFGPSLDIEWATIAGHPFLLQIRPITAALTEAP